jgi:hypothetical protein
MIEEDYFAMKKRRIIYISGEGHSGTTLLDIILGSQTDAFSSGELSYFAQKGLINSEYCACGKPVPECEVWSKVSKEWSKKRKLCLDEYIEIQERLTSKKNILSAYFSLKNAKGEVSHFLNDTQTLYDTIFKVTNSQIIIDSSKAPGKLLILKKLDFDIQIVHLVRRFGDVLNSYKKNTSKNLREGIEHDIMPLSTSYVFPSWLAKNLLTYFFSNDLSYKKIKYENLVLNPLKELSSSLNEDYKFTNKLMQRGPFPINHLVAGNQIRMKDYLYIAEKPMNTAYHRLGRVDRILAKVVDFFY